MRIFGRLSNRIELFLAITDFLFSKGFYEMPVIDTILFAFAMVLVFAATVMLHLGLTRLIPLFLKYSGPGMGDMVFWIAISISLSSFLILQIAHSPWFFAPIALGIGVAIWINRIAGKNAGTTDTHFY